ncbi:MAG: four helix bundle protein [Planctomycetota bacterium]|nr:four helix bundle protein [Planctomycetota bacterium]
MVWQKSHQLVLNIYRITKEFPKAEIFGLISQMRRAAVSVPANIVEGFKKRGIRDKINFYNIAQASLEELRYYLILSKDLGYLVQSEDLDKLADEISKMLTRMIINLDT